MWKKVYGLCVGVDALTDSVAGRHKAQMPALVVAVGKLLEDLTRLEQPDVSSFPRFRL